MKILYIFLQFGASISDPLTSAQLIGFWGVILLLVALFIFFYIRTNKIVADKMGPRSDEHSQKGTPDDAIEEEIAASIALAIHMYKSDLHDQESFTITLKKVSKIYSPWSSKIYTLRQNPR